jgi:hypothetical protein
MNSRFFTTMTLIASSLLIITGCSEDTSAFETPNTSETPTNSGVVSQKNFIVESSDGFPPVIDLATNTFTAQTVDIIVTIGDLNNQILTDEHVVFFKTEWGLIEPSCITKDGECSVTWKTSKSENVPASLTSVITAWTTGEESFTDSNGNGKFDDADTAFEDLEEPFLDINLDGVFDGAGGDEIIDVINGNDLTGTNGVHDIGDTFLNSPSCTHASLCGRTTTFIWNSTFLVLTGPPVAP